MNSNIRYPIIVLVILTCFLLLPIQPIQAQEGGYTETFDDPALPGWERTDNASVADGVLRIEGTGFAINPTPVANPKISLRFKFEGEGHLEIQYLKSEASTYVLQLTPTETMIFVEMGGERVPLNATDIGLTPSQWVGLNIRQIGSEQQVSLDPGIELTATAERDLPAGGLMFHSFGEVVIEFDDLVVTGEVSGEVGEGEPDREPDEPGDEGALPTAVIESPPETEPSTSEGGQPAYLSTPWVFTGGPSGGLGYDIRMKPDNLDVLFVTDAFMGVFKSVDGGKYWFPSNNGITTRFGPSSSQIPVFCLTIDPNDPERIWVGTQYSSGIFRSDDAGDTWTQMNTGLQEKQISIRGFTVEPGDSNTVYMAGEVSSWEWNIEPLPGRGLDMTKGVVYKTEDGGQNWRRIWFGDHLARYVWIHPTNHDLLYVSTGIFDREAANSNSEANDPGGVGILRSKDGGQSWEILGVNHGFDPMDLYIGSLYMHPENPEILLAAAGNDAYGPAGGVYRTEDGGDHWTEVLDAPNLGVVEFCESDPSIAYAGGYVNFYRSTDGGLTWGEPGTVQGAWGPGDVAAGPPIDAQCDPRDTQRVFVNNYVGGAFLTEDGGETWINSSDGYTGAMITHIAIVPEDPAMLFVSARSGVFFTQDGGNHWAGLAYGPARELEIQAIAVNPSHPLNAMITQADVGITPILTNDGGKTWKVVHSGIPYDPERVGMIDQLAFVPSNPNIVLAMLRTYECWRVLQCDAGNGGGVWFSEDGGETWSPSSINEGSVMDFAYFKADDSIWYVMVYGAGLYRSDDFGVTWNLVNPDPLANQIRSQHPDADASRVMTVAALAVSPTDSQNMLAGLSVGGVIRSEDGGKNWQLTSAGMPPEATVWDVVFDPLNPDVAYAASTNSGVFLTLDGGRTWQELNDGLNYRQGEQLAISDDGSVLYLSTEGGGVFRLGTPPKSEAPLVQPTAETPVESPAPMSTQPEMATEPSGEPAQKAPLCGGALALPIIFIGLAWRRSRRAE
jgi:photosystem II stability/assembly factor-like uncharacterized protein